MERTMSPMGGAEETIVCPNCGNRQVVSGIDTRCDRCGTLIDPSGRGKAGLLGGPTPAPSDPVQTTPAMASGGIGGVNDGTQVTRHVPTAVPGKPMAPFADAPAGHSTDEAQGLDPGAGPTLRGGGS